MVNLRPSRNASHPLMTVRKIHILANQLEWILMLTFLMSGLPMQEPPTMSPMMPQTCTIIPIMVVKIGIWLVMDQFCTFLVLVQPFIDGLS